MKLFPQFTVNSVKTDRCVVWSCEPPTLSESANFVKYLFGLPQSWTLSFDQNRCPYVETVNSVSLSRTVGMCAATFSVKGAVAQCREIVFESF